MDSWDKIRDALGLLNVPHKEAKTIQEIGKKLGFTDKEEANRFFYIELQKQHLVQVVNTTKENENLYTISPFGRAILEQYKRDILQRELADLQYEQLKISEKQAKISEEQNKISQSQLGIGKGNNWLLFTLIAVTIAISFFTWSLQKDQLNEFKKSVNKQLELSDAQIVALAPINPDVSLYIDPEDLIFENTELVRVWLDEQGRIKSKNRGVRFEFLVRNTGQTDTGLIRVTEKDDEFHIYQGSSLGQFTIGNIKGLSSIINYSEIFLDNCVGGNKPDDETEPCKAEVVPNGTRNLSFEVFCTFCEPKVKIQTFTMCVWRNSGLECENKTG